MSTSDPQNYDPNIFSTSGHQNYDPNFFSTSDHRSYDRNITNYGYTSKMLLAAVVCLLTVIILVILLHVYAKWLMRRRRRREGAILALWNTPGPLDALHGAPTSANTVKTGLDGAVLALIPVFLYRSSEHKDGLECAVCLSPFDEEEEAKELPPCHHCFHSHCIDSWLQLHSTCPVCRASVVVVVPDEAKIGLGSEIVSGNGTEEVPSTETEPDAGPRSGEAGEVPAEMGESGEVSCSSGPPDISLDMGTVSRFEEGSSAVDSGTGCSFGSLRRMLSKNKSERKVLSSNRTSCGEEAEKV